MEMKFSDMSAKDMAKFLGSAVAMLTEKIIEEKTALLTEKIEALEGRIETLNKEVEDLKAKIAETPVVVAEPGSPVAESKPAEKPFEVDVEIGGGETK